MKKTFFNLMMFIVLLALALAACANPPATQQPVEQISSVPDGIVAEGRLEPIHAANLTFQVRGIVEQVNVKIGDTVKKGDVLARLANFDQAMAQLSTANLELTQAQQAYDQLQRTEGLGRADAWTGYMDAQIVRAEAERAWEALNVDDIEDRIDDSNADVDDRQSDLDDAQEEFDKYKDLDADNVRRQTAEEALEQAQEDYNNAVRVLEQTTRERDAVNASLDAARAAEAEAKYTYEQTLDGPNQEEFTLLSARLENAKAQVAAAEDSLAGYQLIAPFDGVVTNVAVEVGEQASVESSAVSVADTTAWLVETTDVTELEVVNLEVGQKVTFTADALPDIAMTGTVAEISQSSILQGGDVIYTVRIQADEVDARLKWGMTVEVNFEPLEN